LKSTKEVDVVSELALGTIALPPPGFLATLLDGSKVLAYTGEMPWQMKRFTKLLRDGLEDLLY